MDPVDEPERYLQQIRLAEPLEPGLYAVHWGALAGHKTSETRAFVFQIESAPGAQPATAAQTPAAAQKAAPTGAPTAPPKGEAKPAAQGNPAAAKPTDKPRRKTCG